MTITATSTAKKTGIYLIDASIYIFQAHFSPYVECYGTGEKDLSAVFGFTQFLFQFLRRTTPRYVAVARDESLQTGFRHQLHCAYKSNRELPDENLKRQLDACGLIAQSLGLADFASAEFEADDILGTLAKKAQGWFPSDAEICIVSRDKDLSQLLKDERCYLWDYSGNRKRYRDDVVLAYGVSPEQFADYLGLVGDAVDVISGIPGVGPVKARALLNEFGSLQGIYDRLSEVAGLPVRGFKQLAVILEAHKEAAFLSRQLATIVCEVAEGQERFASTQMADLQVRPPNESLFSEILNELDFKHSEADRLLYQFKQLESRHN
ncbi:MAG: DNA polymerase-1 [Pseudohongiellaceae bacterium]|jgi:DNA polymerase-1